MKNSKDDTTVRQNGLYSATSKHAVNLRRNHVLFFQFGLILSLLSAIFFLEMKSPVVAMVTEIDNDPEENVFVVPTFKIETPKPKQKVVKPKAQPKPQVLDQVNQIKDDVVEFDDLVPDALEPDANDAIVDVGSVDYVETDEDIDKGPKPFAAVEDVPLFPGCEKLKNNEERKACMMSKMDKLVRRKFDGDLAQDVGKVGKNKIHIQFKIDVNGNAVFMGARAPHPKLKREAERFVSLIPQMTPGMQRKKPVEVLYSLPITFIVE